MPGVQTCALPISDLRAAARKLKVNPHPDAIPPLIELLRHDDPWVRGDAHGALLVITEMNFSNTYEEWRTWWSRSGVAFAEQWHARNEDPTLGENDYTEVRSTYNKSMGEALLQAGDVTRAISYFRIAAEEKPSDPENHINLGRAFRLYGDYVNAEACFQKAKELNDSLVAPHLNLGICALEQNRYDAAIDHLERARDMEIERVRREMKEQPQQVEPSASWEVYWYLAMTHFERGRRDLNDMAESVKLLERVVNILPPQQHTQKMYLRLALAYYGNDQYRKAWIMIRQLEEKYPGDTVNPDFRNNVKMLLYVNYDYDFSQDGEEPPTMLTTKPEDIGHFKEMLSGSAEATLRFAPN